MRHARDYPQFCVPLNNVFWSTKTEQDEQVIRWSGSMEQLLDNATREGYRLVRLSLGPLDSTPWYAAFDHQQAHGTFGLGRTPIEALTYAFVQAVRFREYVRNLPNKLTPYPPLTTEQRATRLLESEAETTRKQTRLSLQELGLLD